MTSKASGLSQGGPAGMDGRRNPWYTVREAEQKEMNTEDPMAVFTSAAFALRRKLITDALEKAGAKTPATAKTLADAGVVVMGGVAGDADDAVDAFLAGNLRFNPNASCAHHDHGEGHSCGSHCGSHCGGHCGE